MKKIATVFLTLLLALSLLTPALAETAEAWSMPIVDEKITVTGYALQSPQGGDANDMIAWEYYEEMTGIHVEWTNVPTDNKDEVLSVMLFSGDLPDIIYACGFSADDLIKYGSTGVFADLTEPYEKYAVSLQAIVAENPSLQSAITSADGHIYGFPHLKLGDNMRTNKLFINPDWLKEVGKEMPTNFKEFEEVLYAFRDTDCNHNGEKDEIPFIIRYNDFHFLPNLYNFFGLGNRGTGHRYVDWDYENNCLRFIPTAPQFKDLLTVAAKWYADGILDKETFENKSSKQIVAKTSQNLVGVHGDFVTNTGSVYQDIFRCIPVMENYYGEKLWTRRSPLVSDLGAFVISAKSQYVDELVKWADYFYSDEGSILYNMGVEGVTFEFDENGVPQFKDELINNPDGLTLTQMRVKYMGFQSGPGYWSDETYKGAETYWTSTELMDDYRQYLPEEIWESFNATYEESEAMAAVWTDIKAYLDENIAAFIHGDRSLDEWDDYVATIENMGLADYMALYQTLYERYEANI